MKNQLLLLLFFGLFLNCEAKNYSNIIELSKNATKQNFEKTEKSITKIVNKNKNDGYVYNERALFYYKFYKDDLALLDINKAIELIPEKFIFYSLKVDLLFNLDKIEEAKSTIDIMNKMDANIPDSYVYYAIYYSNLDSLQLSLENSNKAISIYEKSSEKNSLISRAYSNSGRMNFAFGNFDLAISNFTKALTKVSDKRKDNIYILRANAYLKKKDITNGFQDLGSALASKPDTTSLAYIYALQGNKEKVEEIIPSIINKKSINTRKCCSEAGKFYNIACYYSILNQPQKALEYIEKTLQSGYNKFNWIQVDFDLYNIKNLPEFKALIDKYKK